MCPGPLRVPLRDCQPAHRSSTRSHGHRVRRIRDDPNWPAPARENARTGLSKTAEGNLVRVRLPLPARPIPLWGKGFPNPYPLVYPGALRRPRPAQKVTESQWLATYRRYDDCEIVTIIG